MPKQRQLANFTLCFGLIFCLLVIPWPGFREGYARWFQCEARLLTKVALPAMIARVSGITDSGPKWADTKIELTDAGKIVTAGSASAATVVLDSRSLGWMPLAMLLALLSATPLIQRHWRSALLAFGLVNFYIGSAIVVAACHALYPVECSGWRGWIFLMADHLLVQNLWSSFVIPTLAWFGCVFPRLGSNPSELATTR